MIYFSWRDMKILNIISNEPTLVSESSTTTVPKPTYSESASDYGSTTINDGSIYWGANNEYESK